MHSEAGRAFGSPIVASSSLASLSGNTDRYRSASTVADASRDRHFDEDSLTVTNFDLLLNLPLFDSSLPEPAVIDSSTTSVEPKANESKIEGSDDDKEDEDDESSFVPVASVKTWDEYRLPKVDEEAVDNGRAKVELKHDERVADANPKRVTETTESVVQPAVYKQADKKTTDDTQEIQPVAGIETVKVEPSTIETKTDSTVALTNHESSNKESTESAFALESPTEPASEITELNTEIDAKDRDPSEVENATIVQPASKAVGSQSTSNHDRESSRDSERNEIAEPTSENVETSRSKVSRRAERLDDKRRERSDDSSNDSSKEVEPATVHQDSFATADASSSTTDTAAPNQAGPISAEAAPNPTVTAPTAIPAATSSAGHRAEPRSQPGKAGTVNPSVGAPTGNSTVTGSSNFMPKTSSPTPAARSTLTEYQEQRVLQRVARGMEQLQNGNSQVRLRLHPPELGSLQVTIRVESQQMAALIEVEHTAARDVLEKNLPQLQARLADQGMTVQQFEIRVVDPNQFSQGDQLGSAWQQNSRQSGEQREERRAANYVDRLRNRVDAPSNEAPTPNPRLWTRTNGQLDVRV